MIFTHRNRDDDLSTTAEARRTITGVLSAYSGILFVDHPLIGVLFAIATFWFPNVGFAGLIGAVVGISVGSLLRLPGATSGANVYSSLLVGLSLGAYYELNFNLFGLIVLTAALTVLLSAALRDLLWRLGHLPILSVPFVVVALTAALAAKTYGGLIPYYAPSQLPPSLITEWLDSFFSSLGSVFFSPSPTVGLLLFGGILLRSRYLAFLCVSGFASGQLVFEALAVDPAPGLLEWTGFNFALTAMALGGIFTVPSVSSYVLAVLGAGASAVVTGALSEALLIYSLPVMALPFLLTTLTFLAALRLRVSTSPPTLLLEHPDLPEINFERARLAGKRLGSLESVPLIAPFLGDWQVYQGFDGKHTHTDQWRYALDFHRLTDGRSFSAEGRELEDYHCFGLPVLSPAYGLVISVKDTFPDNPPGELDLKNNWGNHVVIQTDGGLFVLLAHLKQFSAKVTEGQRVTPNTPIASCGNSGRSPQPHLHMQVQRHGSLGGATVPFHLVSAIVGGYDEIPRYHLVARVGEGDTVQRAEEDHRLAAALQLQVGRTMKFCYTDADGSASVKNLRVDVTLFGQYRLTADSGASAAFEQRNGTLGFYDRRGPSDPVLDLWLLALGLTPLSTLAETWGDAPPAYLLPLRLWTRIGLAIVRPLGAGLASQYERMWSGDQHHWSQVGVHKLRVTGLSRRATSAAVVCPEFGCLTLSLDYGGATARAELLAVGQVADRGVPAWEEEIPRSRPEIEDTGS